MRHLKMFAKGYPDREANLGHNCSALDCTSAPPDTNIRENGGPLKFLLVISRFCQTHQNPASNLPLEAKSIETRQGQALLDYNLWPRPKIDSRLKEALRHFTL